MMFCAFITSVLLYSVLWTSTVAAARSERFVLSTYNGAVTEITCSTEQPSFLINEAFGSFRYNDLPGQFGIEAKVASDTSYVTLSINGTSRTHNVTIECRNLIDFVRGQSESLYQLTLQFIDVLPAPRDLHYNQRNGALSWSSPSLGEFEPVLNITTNTDLMIMYYTIYMTDQLTGLTRNFTSSSTEFDIIKGNLPCGLYIEVSAENPAGESLRSNRLRIDLCNEDQVNIMSEGTPQSNADLDKRTDELGDSGKILSGGIVAVVIVAAFLCIVLVFGSILMVVFIIKIKVSSQTSKSKPRNEEAPAEEIHKQRTPSNSSQTELLSSSSSNETPQQTTTVTGTTTSPAVLQPDHLQESVVHEETKESNDANKTVTIAQERPVIYAELAPRSINKVPQPSSVESTNYAVINHSFHVHTA